MKFHKVCMKCLRAKLFSAFSIGKRICKDCTASTVSKQKKINEPTLLPAQHIPKRFLAYCCNCSAVISRQKHPERKYCSRDCSTTQRFYNQ